MPRLENWGIMIKDSSYVSNDYRFCLYGETYDHHNFDDGTPIITKKIEFFDSAFNVAKTMNNEYVLGEPDQKFMERLEEKGQKVGDFDR